MPILLALLFFAFTTSCYSNLGSTLKEIESENGKPALLKKVNETTEFVVYINEKDQIAFLVIGGSTQLVLTQRKEGSFNEQEAKEVLEKFKTSPNSNWEPATKSSDGKQTLYRLTDGDGRVAMWEDRKVMVSSKEGLAYVKNNITDFDRFLEEIKAWATGIIKEKTDETADQMAVDVIEIGVLDPKKAVLYAVEKRSKGYNSYAFPYFFGRAWYEKNPKEFMQWARTLTSDEFKEANECTIAIVDNIGSAETDEWVKNEMARGSKRNVALFTIGFKKSEADPISAMRWADTFTPEDPGYFTAISSVSVFSSKKMPDEVLEWMIGHSVNLPDYDTGKDACPALLIALNEVFTKDPQKALKKALKIKNEKVKAVECFRLADMYTTADPDQFMEIFLRLKNKEEKNLFFPGFLHSINKSNYNDYRKIADWLIKNEISPFEEDRRNQGLYVSFPLIFQKWFKKDPKGCVEFIRSVQTKTSEGATFKTLVLTSYMGGEDPFEKFQINQVK